MKRIITLYILAIFLILSSTYVYSSSNSKFKHLIDITNYSVGKFPFIIKLGKDIFFIVDKDYYPAHPFEYLIYNYSTNSITYLDTAFVSQNLSKLTLLFFNGLLVESKLILCGVEDKKICFFTNSNGVWGKWNKLIIETKDSLKFGYTYIIADPIYKNILYIAAQDVTRRVHFFISNDYGAKWKHIEGLTIEPALYTASLKPYIAIKPELIYGVSQRAFYRVNLKTNVIDSVYFLTKEEIDSNYTIMNFAFENEFNGIIEVKSVEYKEGISKYQRSIFYKTTDGGLHWQKVSELRFWPNYLFILELKEDYVLCIHDLCDIIESYDFGSSWKIEYADYKQKETIPFAIYSFYQIEDKKYLLYTGGGRTLWELDLTLNNINNLHNTTSPPFPNPARSTTRISLQQEGDISISAVDVLGRSFPLWSGFAPSGEMELDVSSLPTGTYTLLINYGTKVEAVKLIKN